MNSLFYFLTQAALSTLLVACSVSSKSRSTQAIANKVCALIFITAIAVTAMRIPIGDSLSYADRLSSVVHLGLIENLFSKVSDVLFLVLVWVISKIGGESTFVLFVGTGALYTAVLAFGVRRAVDDRDWVYALGMYAQYILYYAYLANVIRQGIAVAFSVVAMSYFFRNQYRLGIVWLLAVPFWHSGSWPAAITIALLSGLLYAGFRRKPKQIWSAVSAIWVVTLVLSLVGANSGIVPSFGLATSFSERHLRYLGMGATDIGLQATLYRTGFRLDFLLFSLIPVVTGVALRFRGEGLSLNGSQWWMVYYLSLNSLYNLFSFIPYSDRIAGYSWMLIPLILYLQVKESKIAVARNLLITTSYCFGALVIFLLLDRTYLPSWAW